MVGIGVGVRLGRLGTFEGPSDGTDDGWGLGGNDGNGDGCCVGRDEFLAALDAWKTPEPWIFFFHIFLPLRYNMTRNG